MIEAMRPKVLVSERPNTSGFSPTYYANAPPGKATMKAMRLLCLGV
jgi:hypothetical protein